ncbi:PQQ-binding-like beta-propeller repeat protein, partial [Candidatus Pacearchaeota archaeon]|nr:PQQ-binding-like beta-propeller repeat protein [Candidatus Pacearchaeota archaeon]
GIVYIGSGDKNFYALNSTNGSQIWNYTTGEGIISSPAVSKEMVYFGSNDFNLYALNSTTGVQIWNYSTNGEVQGSPAVSSSGVLIVGSNDNKTYALNATTGSLFWSYLTNGNFQSSPAISNGLVYIGSNDGYLYAFSSGTSPSVTLNSPSSPYINDTATTSTLNITFNCSATDETGNLESLHLYLTRPNNSSFALNKTTAITGSSNQTNWTIALSPGNYTWNCLANDTLNNQIFGTANRSIILNFTVTSSCTTPVDNLQISSSITLCNGTYYLNDSSADGLINMTTNNTILTCNGTIIIGNTSGTGINADNPISNVTIKNCNIQRYNQGIFGKFTSSTIQNNTVSYISTWGIVTSSAYSADYNQFLFNNVTYNQVGILFQGGSFNNFTGNILSNGTGYILSSGIALVAAGGNVSNSIMVNNTITNNTYGVIFYNTGSLYLNNNTIYSNNISNSGINGIYIYPNSTGNLIYNNFFNNTNNTYDLGTGNSWNTTKTLGTNIIGGAYIGGNFYSDYVGTDNDGDGIGNTIYTIAGSFVNDSLPLTNNLLSVINISACGSLSAANGNYNLNQNINSSGTCITISANNITLNCLGFTINYSQINVGNGIRNFGKNQTTIKNCLITLGNLTSYSSYAIYLGPSEGSSSTIDNNTIIISGGSLYVNKSGNHGILASFYSNTTITNNNITLNDNGGTRAIGIHTWNSSYNTIAYNTITVKNNDTSAGIYLGFSDSNSVFLNNITTYLNNSHGIIISRSTNNNISQNNIITYGYSSYGIYNNYPESNYTKILSNNITTYGYNSRGIHIGVVGFSRNIVGLEVSYNTIITNGTQGGGINVYFTDNSIIKENNITTYGYQGYGISLTEENNFSILNNRISTHSLGLYTYPLIITTNAFNNTIVNNTIRADGGYSIFLSGNSYGNAIYNNIFNSSTYPKYTSYLNGTNIFNQTRTSATNIIGGNYLGGNYWRSDILSRSFSDLCKDYDLDGICDNSILLDSSTNSKDYLALTTSDNTGPFVEIWNPNNETIVNGYVSVIASATDDRAVTLVNFQYKNSSSDWTNLTNCNLTSINYYGDYRCVWNTNLFSNAVEGYNIRAVAYDVSGNTSQSVMHYSIDRTKPIVYNFAPTYPQGQTSIKTGQNISLNATVSDAFFVAAGINYAEVNLSLLNTTQYTNMTFISGSKSSKQNSSWQINITTTVSNTNLASYISFIVYDLALPTNNQASNNWKVKIDNTAPNYTSMGATVGAYNNTYAGFYAFAFDNYDLDHYIFSENSTGNWANSTSIAISGIRDIFDYQKKVYTGTFSYQFLIFDDAGNMNSSELKDIIVFGNSPVPVIYLESPNNTLSLNYSLINMSYYYLNAQFENCSLILDSVVNMSVSNPGSSAFLNFTENVEDGVHSWGISCIRIESLNDESNLTAEYESNEIFNFVVDTTPPSFTVIPENQNLTYKNSLNYYLNATDNLLFDSFAVNDSRFKINLSAGFLELNSDIGVGIYNLNVTINDSVNNRNSTLLLVNITPAEGLVYTLLNNSRGNLTIEPNVNINLNASMQSHGDTVSLYVNESLINTGMSNLGNITNFSLANTYNITSLFNGNENYTLASESWFLKVCNSDSSCAATTCTTTTCEDSCGNSYTGTKDCSIPVTSCFPAGTKISMADGKYKNIEEVKIGDYVLSYDTELEKQVESKVIELESPTRNHMCEIVFDNNKKLKLTSEHPVYTSEGWKSISPDETKKENSALKVSVLKKGDLILFDNEKYVNVKNINCWSEKIKTYNLKSVEKYNNYFAENILVHNKGGGSGGEKECVPSCVGKKYKDSDGCTGSCLLEKFVKSQKKIPKILLVLKPLVVLGVSALLIIVFRIFSSEKLPLLEFSPEFVNIPSWNKENVAFLKK